MDLDDINGGYTKYVYNIWIYDYIFVYDMDLFVYIYIYIYMDMYIYIPPGRVKGGTLGPGGISKKNPIYLQVLI